MGLTAALLSGNMADCAALASSGASKSDIANCLALKKAASLHEPTDMYSEQKQRKSQLYRLGDTSMPVEVIVMRDRFGGPSPHISVTGDATVGQVKYPASDEQIRMTEMGKTEAWEENAQYDQYSDPQKRVMGRRVIDAPSMATPLVGLLGSYYMGWRE